MQTQCNVNANLIHMQCKFHANSKFSANANQIQCNFDATKFVTSTLARPPDVVAVCWLAGGWLLCGFLLTGARLPHWLLAGRPLAGWLPAWPATYREAGSCTGGRQPTIDPYVVWHGPLSIDPYIDRDRPLYRPLSRPG